MRFGEKVRQIRKERGLSQEELARMIGGSSKSMISKIESGKRFTPIPVASRIAAALGVSVSDLLDEGQDGQGVVDEFAPYLEKAEEWQLEAIRKILDMPAKKICLSEEGRG